MRFSGTHSHKTEGNNQRPSARSGFSLVEMLVYIGLLVLVLVAVVNMMLALSKAYGFLKNSRDIQSSAIFSLDRIVREVRNASSIDNANSIFNANPGTLSLNTTTATGTPETIGFSVIGGRIHLKRNGLDVGPLTLAAATTTNLVFRLIATPISQAVRVDLSLQAGSAANLKSANFYVTAILRNSY